MSLKKQKISAMPVNLLKEKKQKISAMPVNLLISSVFSPDKLPIDSVYSCANFLFFFSAGKLDR